VNAGEPFILYFLLLPYGAFSAIGSLLSGKMIIKSNTKLKTESYRNGSLLSGEMKVMLDA
jgi:hypothetical protein